jgi:hypothetical protein
MAHFRGIIKGSRGEASRLGTKHTGIRVEAQSWQGKVVVQLRHNATTGQDIAEVFLQPHEGGGIGRALYTGPVGG